MNCRDRVVDHGRLLDTKDAKQVIQRGIWVEFIERKKAVSPLCGVWVSEVFLELGGLVLNNVPIQ